MHFRSPALYWLNRRSLRFQLLARSFLILAALLLLIGTFQYVFMKNFLFRNEADSLFDNARAPLKEIMERSRQGAGREPAGNATAVRAREPMLFLESTSIALIDANGSFLDITGLNNGAVSPRLPAAEYVRIMRKSKPFTPSSDYRVVRNGEGTEQLIVFRAIGGPGNANGIIQIGKPTAPLKAIALQQLLIFAALSLVALAGSLALYLPVLRRTLHPLQHMIKTVERTDAGNLDNRVPVGQGQEEIDRLAESFNGMMSRLAASFEAEREAKEQMRRFIADASHELRTPLTSIHGFLEVLLRGAADKREQLHSALDSMRGESVRMKKLVEDLLLLAKLDRAPELSLRETDLNELAIEMEPHLRMLAGNRTVRIDMVRIDMVEAAETHGIYGTFDPDKVKQVVLNLFHNAVQHTDPVEGQIVVTVRSDAEYGYIDISDNGSGIPAEHLPHLFERFYRIDSSRTRKLGGAGLGLSISQSIAEAHGGSIAAASEAGRGSTFTLRLPLHNMG
nr:MULTISPECIES: HAMP domain-containing sensor histidine kinase [unclassified Paenibacillus]